MTIPNGTGASWFELGFGTAGTNLTLIEASVIANAPELANTFIYRTRGPQSSEGWFLTTRHELERLFPQMLPDELLSTDEQVAYKDNGWNPQSVVLKIKNQPASFGTVDSSLETDIEIRNLYLESAYVLPEFSSGVPANYETVGQYQRRDSFTDQETAATNSWDMQLCLVHVVDRRWYAQEKGKPSHLKHFLPRPFLMRGESFGETDDIHWGNGVPVDHPSNTGSYSDLFGALEQNTEANFGYVVDKTNADFPTLCRNYNLQGLDSYRCYFEILNEISHTLVWDIFEGTSSGVRIEPKGRDESTTATERTNFKNLSMLHSASNDMRHKKGTILYEVLFPAEVSEQLPTWGNRPSDGSDTSSSYVWTDVSTNRQLRVSHTPDTYLRIYVTLDGSQSLNSITFYAEGMESIYGDNKVPYSGPLDASTTIKGRLFARLKPTDSGTVWSEVSNKVELENHAKELVLLRAKEFHYENNGKNFFNETYLGFLKFTPTKDLSAIIWSDTGSGATTKIVNRPFKEDHKAYTESPNFIHPGEVEPIEINEFPPDSFYGTFTQTALVTNDVGDRKEFFGPEETFLSGLGLSYGSPTVINGLSNPDGDRSRHATLDVTVRNKTRYPLFNSWMLAGTSHSGYGTTGYSYDTAVEILWNRQAEEWQTYSVPYTLGGSMSGGTLTIYYFNKEGTWTPTPHTIPVKAIPNMGVTTSPTNVTVKRLGLSHVWVIDAEGCPS